jgi:hypothetical protein
VLSTRPGGPGREEIGSPKMRESARGSGRRLRRPIGTAQGKPVATLGFLPDCPRQTRSFNVAPHTKSKEARSIRRISCALCSIRSFAINREGFLVRHQTEQNWAERGRKARILSEIEEEPRVRSEMQFVHWAKRNLCLSYSCHLNIRTLSP